MGYRGHVRKVNKIEYGRCSYSYWNEVLDGVLNTFAGYDVSIDWTEHHWMIGRDSLREVVDILERNEEDTLKELERIIYDHDISDEYTLEEFRDELIDLFVDWINESDQDDYWIYIDWF